MNIYVLLRLILHLLLSAANFLALIAAAWTISASKGEGQPRAPPGAVLVVVGTIAFVILDIMIWAETCIPRTLMSSVRTELALVPMLVVLQLVAAAVATCDTVLSVCPDPTSCLTLLVLAWVPPLCLITYYLVVLAVTFDHSKTDPNIWDASPLSHPWFHRAPHPSPKPSVSLLTPLRTEPAIPSHRPQQSSMTLPLMALPPPMPAAQRSSVDSARISFPSIYIPNWARDLQPLRRGRETPFPVRTRNPTNISFPVRNHKPTNRWEDPSCIDAPVSPSLNGEFP